MHLAKPIAFWAKVLVGCVVFSPPVAAQDNNGASQIAETGKTAGTESRVLLWGKVAHGMTKAEAKALHPDKLIQLSDNCFASLEFNTKKSKVYSVELNWSSKNKDQYKCVDVALRSLKEKYGEPEIDKLVEDNSFGAMLASSLNQSTGINKGTSGTNVIMKRVVSWSSNNISITMRMDPDIEHIWSITYQMKERSSGVL